jgi:hypothetical protein
VTHIDLKWLPIQSYGFMVAPWVTTAAYVITKELRRREMLGWMPALSHKHGYRMDIDSGGRFVIICAIFGITGSSFFNYLESPASYSHVFDHGATVFARSAPFSAACLYMEE